MSKRDPNRLTDGFYSLEAGVNSGSNPSLINRNQVSFMVNGTVRGGFADSRPGFKKVNLTFKDSDTQDLFEDFNVQGAGFYLSNNGNPKIIASIGGQIFAIDPLENVVANTVNITPAADGNSSVGRQAWMVQAEQYFVIQDGSSKPFIYDGATLRRSNPNPPAYEVPVGTAMEYGLGRLIVVRPNRREYVIGDLLNSGKEVIQFTENNFLNEGGAATVPIPGLITAVKFIAVLDNSTGQGELVIHTRNGAVTARVGENRTTWKEIQFQRVAMLKNGALSQNGTVLANGDMFFRAPDGIRSLAMARRDFVSKWVNTPISREMERVLKNDDRGMLHYSNAVLFDNRIIFTAVPTRLPNGCYHRGLVVLDLDLISTIGEKLPPAYDGLWTGLNVTAMVTGEWPQGERCFVFHRNEDGKNELWELTRNEPFDNTDTRIPSFLESRSMQYETPFDLKKLEGADLSIDRLAGTVDLDLKYRPDQYPLWNNWHSWTECATQKDCDADDLGCQPTTPYHPQYRSRMQIPQPADTCESSDNKPMRLGYEFQFRLAWLGKARIKSFRPFVHTQEESPYGCVTNGECKSLTGCEIDPFAYKVS